MWKAYLLPSPCQHLLKCIEWNIVQSVLTALLCCFDSLNQQKSVSSVKDYFLLRKAALSILYVQMLSVFDQVEKF